MQAPAHIKTAEQYLANLAADRRAAIETIHQAILKAVPGTEARICYGMLGYGPAGAEAKSGSADEWAVVVLASQKNYISLYIGCSEGSATLAEENKDRLGKVSVGKSCVRFKKLEHLDLKVAMELVKKSAKLAAGAAKP